MLARLILTAMVIALVPAAATAEGWKTSYVLGVASDSNSKGASETQGNAQARAQVIVRNGVFVTSARFSTYKGSDGSDQQITLGAGVRTTLSKVAVRSVLYYKVNDVARDGADNDYYEWQTDVSRAFGDTTLRGQVIYSPDSNGATKEAWYYEVGVAHKVSARWSLSAAVGQRTTSPARSYNAWNAGAIWAIDDKTSLDFRYYDTDRHDYSKSHLDRYVVAFQRKF